MNIKAVIAALLMLLPATFYGQGRDSGLVTHTAFIGGGTLGKNNQRYTQIGHQIAGGYAFNKSLSLLLVMDLTADLFTRDGVDSHYLNTTPGVMLGINLTQPRDEERWQLYTSAGGTVTHNDYRYLYGEVGLKRIERGKGWRLFYSAGLRYQKSCGKAFDNYLLANICLGFVFGR